LSFIFFLLSDGGRHGPITHGLDRAFVNVAGPEVMLQRNIHFVQRKINRASTAMLRLMKGYA